jgi:hypothetical protein
MQLSYSTLVLLASFGDKSAVDAKKDCWVLMNQETTPAAFMITFDAKNNDFMASIVATEPDSGHFELVSRKPTAVEQMSIPTVPAMKRVVTPIPPPLEEGLRTEHPTLELPNVHRNKVKELSPMGYSMILG